MTRRGLMLLAVVVFSATDAAALEVLLQNGKRYVGEVSLSPQTVSVKSGRTTYQIPRGSVTAVELQGSEVREYERRKAALGASAENHFAFAEWLASKLQFAEAEQYYEKTVQIDPDHKLAREALGYRQTEGKWVLSEEDRGRIRSGWLGREGADGCCELAKIYRKSGDEKRAEAMLRRALIAYPAHLAALEMLRPITDKYVCRNKYRLPFDGLWAVIYDHSTANNQPCFMAYGFDFVKVDDAFSSTRVAQPTRLEDFYTWDAPVCASADGVVYSVNNDFDDLPLGAAGELWSANMVCVKHPQNEYTVYGHLKKGSIIVKKGQPVKAGDVLARVGNSGSSGAPHLHWALYDRDGIGLPCTFVDFTEVGRAGEEKTESGRIQAGRFYRNTFGGKP